MTTWQAPPATQGIDRLGPTSLERGKRSEKVGGAVVLGAAVAPVVAAYLTVLMASPLPSPFCAPAETSQIRVHSDLSERHPPLRIRFLQQSGVAVIHFSTIDT